MNWFQKLEQQRKLIISGTIILCLAVLVVTMRRDNLSLDSFWHLRMGIDWLQNGMTFGRDHYSFTFNGKEISSPPFMFQVLLGWLVSQFGLNTGFELYKLIAFLFTFSTVTFFLHRLRSPVVIYILTLPLLVVLLQMRSIVRPELISYGFAVVAIILYHRANNQITINSMLPIAGLMLIWSNYHTSSIFGFVIFFGLFLDLAIHQFRQNAPKSAWSMWLIWGLIVVAMGFINPSVSHPVIRALTFAPDWKNIITEYQTDYQLRDIPVIFSLLVASLGTIILLFRKRQFGLLLICLILGFSSIDMARLISPSGIVILCIFTWSVSEIDLQSAIEHISPALGRVLTGCLALVAICSLSTSIYFAYIYMLENQATTQFPEDVADYMVDHHIQGRIFNDYGVGGYLIYRLSPYSQVYVDGRANILYPLEHVHRYLFAKESVDLLGDEIEKYGIDLAILPNQRQYFALARETGSLGLDYVGNRFSLFREDKPNFPTLGTLLASPACWNPEMSLALEAEQDKAREILPANSSLSQAFMMFLVEYSRSEYKPALLKSLQFDRPWPPFKLRFTAYQALSNNLDLMAYDLFLAIPEKEFSDYLGAALTLARVGEWKKVEQILDDATRLTVSYRQSEIKILHHLLIQVRQNNGLELFDEVYVKHLGESANSEPGTLPPGLPEVSAFCPKV